jgi:hypothetical protein
MSKALVRTASGLSNQHILLGVDFVVYVEGGGEFGDASAAAATGADDTPDAEFWRTVLGITSPGSTFHVKSVGCRRVAEEIALAIARSRAQGSFVCTDSDICCLLSDVGPLAPTLRTWGYSWENDVACWEVAERVFTDMLGGSAKAQDALRQFKEWYDHHLDQYIPYIAPDAKQIKIGLPAVFDRDAPVRPFGPTASNCPELDTAHLDARLIPDKRQDTIEIDEGAISPLRHGFGKTLLKAVFHAFVHFAQMVRRGRVDFDSYVGLCISALRSALPRRVDALTHYSNGFRSISGG